jgi:hypothetical protein
METKWLAISLAVLFGGTMTAAGVTEYQKGQCKIAYVQSTKTAEEISKICGK